MRQIYLPLSIFCLSVSLLLFPVKRAGSTKSLSTNESFAISSSDEHAAKADAILEAASEVIYDSLGLNTLGLSKEAMLYAYKGQQKLEEEGKLSNPDILTVCDFSQSSQSKRMYIIDTRNYKVLMNTYVAHGRNSGLDYAEHFSNAPESLESSLGFYITKNTYIGKHGLSLKIEGLERGYNDNAESREVVVHGAPYIGDSRARAAYMGRSFGCPAVPQKIAPKVINLIKNGTCLFIYHPSRSYLQGSKILNG